MAREIHIDIYRSGDELPVLGGSNFFHSRELFHIYASTPRHTPFMIVARGEGGAELGHLLAVVRTRLSWMPPYAYWHCRVLGEGDYAEGCDKVEVFGAMLEALAERMQRNALYIEMSHLSEKMFGYREFRQCGFFPVKWMSIHNSLHSKRAEERMSAKTLHWIEAAEAKGVYTVDVRAEEQLTAFLRLLRKHNKLKPKRFIPPDAFFRALMSSDNARMTITKVRDKTIGCAACVYSGGNAYLWYSAFRRKSYAILRPAYATTFAAIKRAEKEGCRHIFFLDVGLPFRRNPYREFILRFGGKPVSTYRWFRFNIGWLNRLLSFFYRS